MGFNKTVHQWENAAESFAADQERSEYADCNKAVVRDRFKLLHGEAVLDLGCGYGYYTEYFRSIGGKVVGVDGAESMIRIAKNRYPSCSFSIVDILEPLPFAESSFDILFCNQVLMDIERIEALLRECHRILKTGGIFYFSIVHPAFYHGKWQVDEKGCKYAKAISLYRSEFTLQNHFWGETAHFHRPISHYLNAAADAGFALKHTDEPKCYDGVMKNADLPLFFFAEYKKP
ncbi:MAG: class I SAM-dependent methyltransferase [Clostridia bacterium]|nr:class I SAM-dependent methyltransferase [Clostridia bacterium]